MTLKQLSEPSLAVNPPDLAINLIPEHESKEEDISVAYQVILARHIGIDLNALGNKSGGGNA